MSIWPRWGTRIAKSNAPRSSGVARAAHKNWRMLVIPASARYLSHRTHLMCTTSSNANSTRSSITRQLWSASGKTNRVSRMRRISRISPARCLRALTSVSTLRQASSQWTREMPMSMHRRSCHPDSGATPSRPKVNTSLAAKRQACSIGHPAIWSICRLPSRKTWKRMASHSWDFIRSTQPRLRLWLHSRCEIRGYPDPLLHLSSLQPLLRIDLHYRSRASYPMSPRHQTKLSNYSTISSKMWQTIRTRRRFRCIRLYRWSFRRRISLISLILAMMWAAWISSLTLRSMPNPWVSPLRETAHWRKSNGK